MERIHTKCAILVAGRDSYRETWEPFFSLFFRYWPDCPFPVYLMTEEETYQDERVLPLRIPATPDIPWEKQWSKRMSVALDQIDTPFFIFMHTDYFLGRAVNTARLVTYLDLLATRPDIGAIRLIADPPPHDPWSEDARLGVIRKGTLFSASFQATLWRTETFRQILSLGDTPGECETRGSAESGSIAGLFLGVWKENPVLPYINGIHKGMWRYDALRLMQKHGMPVATNRPRERYGAYLARVSGYATFRKRLLRALQRLLHPAFATRESKEIER